MCCDLETCSDVGDRRRGASLWCWRS
jgi:hypothetical protein